MTLKNLDRINTLYNVHSGNVNIKVLNGARGLIQVGNAQIETFMSIQSAIKTIVLRDDVITQMTVYLDDHPEIGMLSPKIEFPDGRPQILGKKIPKPYYLAASRLRGKAPGKILRDYAMLDEDMSVPRRIENATGCFMVIRTEIFRKLGGFDSRYFMYFEDCDLTREVNKISKVFYFPYSTVYHEWGRESKKDMKLKIIQIHSMLKYYSKWGI